MQREGLSMNHWTARTLIPILVVALAALSTPGAMAAPANATEDHLGLVSVTTRAATTESVDVIPFQVVVNYQLQSADSGFLLLFVFENEAVSSTSQSSATLPIESGSGQQTFNIDYPLKPNVRTLTLMVAMFKSQQSLITWASTKPIDLAPWPGRAAFDKAMAARGTGDYASADNFFSQAIQASPGTGTYYYWRGETRTHLNEYTDAIDDFNRSIDLMPDDLASRVGRGVALLWSGDAQSAIGDLSFAIDRSTGPDHLTALAYRARATAEAALKQAPEAITDYQAYLAIAPDAPDRSQVEGWIADLS
jgi:tetratricopeptide (TPR) repeat protein